MRCERMEYLRSVFPYNYHMPEAIEHPPFWTFRVPERDLRLWFRILNDRRSGRRIGIDLPEGAMPYPKYGNG